jgi:hypothetical protein
MFQVVSFSRANTCNALAAEAGRWEEADVALREASFCWFVVLKASRDIGLRGKSQPAGGGEGAGGGQECAV